MRILRTSCIPLLLLVLSGCGQNVSKPDAEQASSSPPQTRAMGAPDAMPQAAATGLRFQVPKDWTETPADSSFRERQFSVPGPAGEAEVVVFFFGTGQGGGVQANLRRWANQFSEPEGEARTFELSSPAGPITGIEIAGTYSPGPMTGGGAQADARLIAAVVESDAGNRFVRLVGPDRTVASQRGAFEAFVQSASVTDG